MIGKSMGANFVNQIPVRYIYWACSFFASGLFTLLGVFGKKAIDVARSDRKKFIETIPKVDIILTNHLPHIQEAVEGMAAKQEKTNLELAEQTGYLKAIAESVRRA